MTNSTTRKKLREIINRLAMAIESTCTGRYRKLKAKQYEYVVNEIMEVLDEQD